MPIEWPFKAYDDGYQDWRDMPYEQRMRRIRWFALTWANLLT